MSAAINISRLVISKANDGQVKLSRVAVIKSNVNSIRLSRASVAATQPVKPSIKISRAEVDSTAVVGGVSLNLSRAQVAVPPTVSVFASTYLADSQSSVLLSATVNGSPDQWDWEQVAGPAVNLSGSGDRRTFIAPATTGGTGIAVAVRALYGGVWTEYAQVTVTVSRHTWWRKGVNGLYPVQIHTGLDVVPPPPPAIPAINLSRVSSSVPADQTPRTISLSRVDVSALTPVSPPPGTPSPGVFYALPSNIQTYPKKIFSHYFGPYPRSWANETSAAVDHYSTQNNNPASTSVKFWNRPLFRPRSSSSTWQVDDCKFDIITAYNAGLDGFVCDLLGLSGSNYQNYEYLKTALRQLRATDPKYNNFYVGAMVDCNGGTGAAAYNTAGDYVLTFKDTTWKLPDGRMFWSAFKATGGASSSWLKQVADYMTGTKATPNAFIPSLVDFNQASDYYSWAYGVGSWGFGADPVCVNAVSNQAATVHSNGVKYFNPLPPQDVRPNSGGIYDEACNTEALIAGWMKAINQGADLAQLVTWSDYSETPSGPSVQMNYGVLDISGYYLTWWKTGAPPPILVDALYLSHREAPVAAVAQTGPGAYQRNRGTQSVPRDTVEVLSFLIAPATITVTVGGVPTTYTAPAGKSTKLVPLAVGNPPSVVAKRAGVTVAQVTSTRAVTNNPYVNDKGYWWFSSARGTAGQERHPGPNPPYPDIA